MDSELPSKPFHGNTFSKMVTRTLISWVVFILHILNILPSGKSTLRDKNGLIFWTALTSSMTFTFVYLKLDVAFALLSQHSVYSLFMVLQGFFVPGSLIIATIPALYHLISYYPQIMEDNLLSSLKRPWIFAVNLILCILCYILTYEGVSKTCRLDMFSCVMTLTFMVIYFGEQILMFFIIDICMIQMRKKIDNVGTGVAELKGMTKKLASKILRDYGILKEGIAPLLFVIFSLNSVSIIALSVQIIVSPSWMLGANTVFLLWDLFYITITVDETFESLRAFLQELR